MRAATGSVRRALRRLEPDERGVGRFFWTGSWSAPGSTAPESMRTPIACDGAEFSRKHVIAGPYIGALNRMVQERRWMQVQLGSGPSFHTTLTSCKAAISG